MHFVFKSEYIENLLKYTIFIKFYGKSAHLIIILFLLA